MTGPRRFDLHYLTDAWEWEGVFVAESVEQAKAVARGALETLVREEAPALACVTLLEGGAKLGVWDWVYGRPYWTDADDAA